MQGPRGAQRGGRGTPIQGYVAHKKTSTPLGPPYNTTHRPTVGSCGVGGCYKLGNPVQGYLTHAALPPPTLQRAYEFSFTVFRGWKGLLASEVQRFLAQ